MAGQLPLMLFPGKWLSPPSMRLQFAPCLGRKGQSLLGAWGSKPLPVHQLRGLSGTRMGKGRTTRRDASAKYSDSSQCCVLSVFILVPS